MNETTFENAKVGDSVWDVKLGWGKVAAIDTSLALSVAVNFAYGSYNCYLPTGREGEWLRQTLFWDEIKFEAPPRPKRMVKKVLEGWVNIYMSTNPKDRYELGEFVHSTIDDAIRKRGFLIPLGEPLFIHHEYEVEE